MRILLPKQPKSVSLTSLARSSAVEAATQEWDADSRTLLLGFENEPDGVKVELKW